MRKYDHRPDKWVVLEVIDDEGKTFHKVFASWSGSYTEGESWRLNSGVDRVETFKDSFLVHSESGATYRLHKEMYGVAGLGNYGVLKSLEEKFPDRIKVLDKAPDTW